MPAAITLATMLRHRKMTQWLRAELEGYAKDAEVPCYRHQVRGQILARSPQYGWIPAPIDKQQLKQFGHLDIREGLQELESVCINCKKGQGHRVALEAKQLCHLQQKLNLSAELSINVERATYCKLLKQIRGSLYLWIEALAEAGLTGNHNSFRQEERDRVTTLDNPERFWREAETSLDQIPVPNVREAGFLERMFGRAS